MTFLNNNKNRICHQWSCFSENMKISYSGRIKLIPAASSVMHQGMENNENSKYIRKYKLCGLS